ncbi:gliding motility-associated C-terminal domain-containing protein [Aurantibacillus circumpalustris]|uniref:gliding motility-associated C-terminal domain-containing protein n=1 Tax=Aurantibacillus circumpalustris TaxID=3036359 RepID=UPI00295BF26F|nr:gliding motility-associated C-terminal domain-containing protein [Aurantibacillus circumpalustris]
MKKCIFFLFFSLSLFNGFSQINDNCINAIPLCSTPSFTFFTNSGPGSVVDFSNTSTVSNPTTNPFPPNSGCLNQGELNPQWLLLTIGNAGMLEFVFGAGNSANPQAGFYDWSMWPYSPTACAGIFNNTLPPIRCNWNGSSAGGTGIASAGNITSVGGNTSNFGDPLSVNACQQFVICISNFSGVNTLVSFLSLGTASLSCNPNCNPNYAMCHGSSATIFPVNFAALANPVFSIQPGGTTNTTGSFVVTPSVTTSYTTFITGLNSVNAVQTITSVSTVTVNPQPTVAPTVTNTTCTNTVNAVNLNLFFNPVGSSPSYSVSWSPIPNGVGSSTQTTFTGGISPGLYTATLTTASGCSTTTSFSVNPLPDPAIIVLNPPGNSHVITCRSDVTLTPVNAAYNYTWSSNVANFNGPVGVFTSTLAGNWLLIAQNPVSGCVASQTFAILQNTTMPASVLSPTFQTINCNIGSISTVTSAATPSINVTHQILSPQGGTFSVQSHTIAYNPGGIGTFTHCVVNDANGCSSCSTFTVSSSSGFPTYTVTSPQNFTLGCNSKSFAIVNIDGGATTLPPGGAVSYSIIGPPTSTATPSGILSGISVYTVTVPGTWTVITKDNVSFCETRTPISILSNTFTPDVSAIVPRQILDCYVSKITLRGQSLTNNVSYLWNFSGNPGSLQGDTITANSLSLSPTNTLVQNYTLVVTNNNSTCKSNSVIPIYQNLFPPKAVISAGTGSLTCSIYTIVLTNQSSTTIPPLSGFQYNLPVTAYLWDGPSPQVQGQLQSTYIAATTGIYTLTARDLNNGCITKTTTTIFDYRKYPSVNKPIPPPPDTLDCGADFVSISPILEGSTNGYTYNWLAPFGTTISSPPYTATLKVTKIGDYRVTITNTLNGCASVGDLSVVNGTLNADFEVLPSKGFAPLAVTFYNNSRSSLGPANVNAYWNFANNTQSVTNPSDLSPSTTYSLPGIYKVMMFATKGTCVDSMSKTIVVDIPSVLEIPNVFTPNGDNVNDLFFVKATNLSEISIIIYDRWGNIVYDLLSTTGNIAWDGKTKAGKEAADGTYLYIITAKGKDGNEYNKKGTLSLFR